MSAKKADQAEAIPSNEEETAIALPNMSQAHDQAVTVTDILGDFGLFVVLGERESIKEAVFNPFGLSAAEYLDLELFSACGHHVPFCIRRSVIYAVGQEHEAEININIYNVDDAEAPEKAPTIVTIGGATH